MKAHWLNHLILLSEDFWETGQTQLERAIKGSDT